MRTAALAAALLLSACVQGASSEPAPKAVVSDGGASVDALRHDDRRSSLAFGGVVPSMPPSHGAGPRAVIVGRPIVPIPSPRLKVEAVTGGLLTGGHHASGTARGVASWYCGSGSRCTRGYGPDCLCAAAGPGLRIGDWRGRIVTVRSAGGVVVRVRLIDCNCGPNANLIDLYSVAFRRLAPLSRGVVKVTVTWP